MKYGTWLPLLLLGGCASEKSVSVTVASTRVPLVLTGQITPQPNVAPKVAPTTRPKATPVPAPDVEVRAVEFSPDARFLAVGTLRRGVSIDGTISVRDCATNRVVKSWALGGGAKFLAFSPDGKWLASTGADNDLRVWNWRTGRVVHRQQLDVGSGGSDRQSLAFSPNGRFLVIGVDGVKLFGTKRWKSREVMAHDAPVGLVGSVCFSPDGRFLLAADDFEGDAGYSFVALRNGKVRSIPNELAWSSPCFSHDGRFFAGSGDHAVPHGEGFHGAFVWNTHNLKLRRTFRSEQFQPQDFSPDNRFVVGLCIESNSEEADAGPVEIWSVATGKRVRRFKESARRVLWLKNNTLLVGDEKGVRRIAVAPLR